MGGPWPPWVITWLRHCEREKERERELKYLDVAWGQGRCCRDTLKDEVLISQSCFCRRQSRNLRFGPSQSPISRCRAALGVQCCCYLTHILPTSYIIHLAWMSGPTSQFIHFRIWVYLSSTYHAYYYAHKQA